MTRRPPGLARNLAIALLLGAAISARAQSPIYTSGFVITSLYISGSQNFTVRAYGSGVPSTCNAGFVYVNEADDAAKEKISALQLAYAMGKTVSFTLQQMNGTFCNVVEFSMTG